MWEEVSGATLKGKKNLLPQADSFLGIAPVGEGICTYQGIRPVLIELSVMMVSLDTLIMSYKIRNFFNPIALKRAKTPQSFGHSECNRVNTK